MQTDHILNSDIECYSIGSIWDASEEKETSEIKRNLWREADHSGDATSCSSQHSLFSGVLWLEIVPVVTSHIQCTAFSFCIQQDKLRINKCHTVMPTHLLKLPLAYAPTSVVR